MTVFAYAPARVVTMQDRGYGTVVTRVECEAGSRPFRKALTKLRRAGCGQAFVEFAIMAPLALMLILVGIQFAIIGTASLGLGQVNYQGARYAANNTSASAAAVQSYMLSVASPIIGANSGSYLTSSLSPAPPCAFGATVTVAVTFDTRHLVLLPNPFLGIPFPTTLTNSESAFCE